MKLLMWLKSKLMNVRYLRIFALFIFVVPINGFCSHFIHYKRVNQTLVLTTDKGNIRITAYSPYVMETFYQYKGVKQLPSWSIATSPIATKTRIKETVSTLEFTTPHLKAIIQKHPVKIAYYRNDKLLLSEQNGYFSDKSQKGFNFKITEQEKLLGGGERALKMDRRGFKLPLYNRAHYAYENNAPEMNYSVPAVMSNKKYILLFDNTARGFIDFGKTNKNSLTFSAVGGRTSYIVFSGDSYPDLIHHYVDITGKQPLPPRWAFGNFASRFGYHTQKQTEETVNKFFQEDFPVDGVILDLYWFGPEIKGFMGDLEWDKNAFPNPTKMIADFKNKGIKTVIITEPFILTTSKNWQAAVSHNVLAKDENGKPKRFDFYFGNTGLIDVFSEKANDWFWQFYQTLMDQGIEGWWGDLGEPEVHPADTVHVIGTGDELHNVYGHQWTRMIYERQQKYFPDKRAFILMRSGFAGTQRYGILPWTGDVSRTWGGLKPQVQISLQMGLLGLGYTHSDLGGFTHIQKFDSELYTRWLQYGVFQPVYRPHADEVFPSEPVFQDEKTKNIIRKFIKLRYEMLPYNYTLAFENSTTGIPLMRPLFFEDESDSTLIDNSESYLWGNEFLVTPVIEPLVTSVAVDIPKGIWFDFWNGKRYEGENKVNIPVTIQTIPVLVRAGAFIPMVEHLSNTDKYSSERLNIHFYEDASITSSKGKMYEDDGHENHAIEKGDFEILRFKSLKNDQNRMFTFIREGSGYTGMPEKRQIQLIIHHWKNKPESVLDNGSKLKRLEHSEQLSQTSNSYFFDKKNQILTVKFFWEKEKKLLEIIKKI